MHKHLYLQLSFLRCHLNRVIHSKACLLNCLLLPGTQLWFHQQNCTFLCIFCGLAIFLLLKSNDRRDPFHNRSLRHSIRLLVLELCKWFQKVVECFVGTPSLYHNQNGKRMILLMFRLYKSRFRIFYPYINGRKDIAVQLLSFISNLPQQHKMLNFSF